MCRGIKKEDQAEKKSFLFLEKLMLPNEICLKFAQNSPCLVVNIVIIFIVIILIFSAVLIGELIDVLQMVLIIFIEAIIPNSYNNVCNHYHSKFFDFKTPLLSPFLFKRTETCE